jgi:hypothetical protein
MLSVHCRRCGRFLARVCPLPGTRLELPACPWCHFWGLAAVDGDGVLHVLAFRTRAAMETARLLADTPPLDSHAVRRYTMSSQCATVGATSQRAIHGPGV